MQLTIKVNGAHGRLDDEMEVREFRDYDKIAARVASAVKAWMREVPVGKGSSTLKLEVVGQWREAAQHLTPQQTVTMHVKPAKRTHTNKRRHR